MNRQGIANAALDWLHMLGVYRAISGKCMNSAAQTDAKTHRIGRVTHTDFLLKTGAQIHERHSAVEHHINRFAKAWLRGGLMGSGHRVMSFDVPTLCRVFQLERSARDHYGCDLMKV